MNDRQEIAHCAALLKVFTDSHRLRILDILFMGELTVSVIADAIGIDLTTASHHLNVMHKAGLVQSRRNGRFVHYSLHPGVLQWKDGRLLKTINLGFCIMDFEPEVNVQSDDATVRAD